MLNQAINSWTTISDASRKMILALILTTILGGCTFHDEPKPGKTQELVESKHTPPVNRVNTKEPTTSEQTASEDQVKVKDPTASPPSSIKDLEIKGLENPNEASLSGLAIIEDFLVLLPQKQERIYWIKIEDVEEALKGEVLSISVNVTKIKGSSMPSLEKDGNGWEAITGGKSNSNTLFLGYEDNDQEHFVYTATYEINQNELKNVRIKEKRALPQVNGNSNYSYESLVWLDGHGLLAFPEIYSENTKGRIFRENGPPNGKPLSIHFHPSLRSDQYRVSDASATISETRLLATSFCFYKSEKEGEQDKPCMLKSPEKESRSRLLCVDVSYSNVIEVSDATVSFIDEEDLPLKTTDEKNDFNVEGVVHLKSGILLVNDNKPPGNIESSLRYLPDSRIKNFRDRCLNSAP